MSSEVAATNSPAAIAARAGVSRILVQSAFDGAAVTERAGMTFPGTVSSEDTMREAPAINPRASATIGAQ